MAVLRRGTPSETVVLQGGPRDGGEMAIQVAADLPAEIPDEVQGAYELARDGAEPTRDRQGRPIYRWAPPDPAAGPIRPDH